LADVQVSSGVTSSQFGAKFSLRKEGKLTPQGGAEEANRPNIEAKQREFREKILNTLAVLGWTSKRERTQQKTNSLRLPYKKRKGMLEELRIKNFGEVKKANKIGEELKNHRRVIKVLPGISSET